MRVPLACRADEVTVNAAAALCGITQTMFRKLVTTGRGPAWRAVEGTCWRRSPRAETLRVIRRAALRTWIVQPEVWPYIHLRDMRDPMLRHLVEQAQRTHTHRWWSTPELARACYTKRDGIGVWRARGWPVGGRWIRVEGRRGLLWWSETAPLPPPPDRRFKEARYAAD